MIKVNEYHEGKVKSLGFESDNTEYTAGVMLPGEYSFTVEREEHITVVLGGAETYSAGIGWKKVGRGETMVVPAGSTLVMRIAKPAAYICRYQ